MRGGLIRYVFGRDYSVAHAVGGGFVTCAAFSHHYVAAAIGFFVALAICVAGEIALERRS